MKQLFIIMVLCLSLFAQATNEIFFNYDTGSTTLKVSITNSATQAIWDGDSFESDTDWPSRSNGVTENANDPGMYYASMPAVAGGTYIIRVWDSVDGTLSSGDPHIMTFTLDWGGTAEVWNKDIKADVAVAQADLDLLTGVDGVTLATLQANYAPAIAGDAMALTAAAVDAIWDEDISAHSTANTSGDLLYDLATAWLNGGRLDLLIDAILLDTGTSLPATVQQSGNTFGL